MAKITVPKTTIPHIPKEGTQTLFIDEVDGLVKKIDDQGNVITLEGGGGGGEILIEITRDDLTNAIANNELIAGATYKITGVHKAHTVNRKPVPALYDDGRGLGTTIFLKAVSENKLENSGSGIFYNPKYDLNTQGYGIWTNKVSVMLSNISGTFDLANRETVTTNNGATGKILTKGWIEYISGDWVNATSITGDDSGARADINSVSVPSYAINDVVFWGGYAWENKNGNVGSSTDILNLNSEWEKLDYTDSNYNKVVDYIEYDIDNDFITRRRNEEYNIDVNEVFGNFNLINFQYSSISVMNYGLGFSVDWLGRNGINGVKVNNSYAELVNFKGGVFISVNFDNGGIFYNVNFDNQSSFNNVNFDNNSRFTNVNFDNNSYFNNVNFDNKSSFNNVNFDNGSYFYNVNFDGFVLSYSSPTLLLDNKQIRHTDFKGANVNLSLPDLSSATVIFDNNRKEVIYIQGATNNCKLITYDTSGNRVVNDIDD